LVSSTTSALLTPEEHTITITAAADNLDANMKRPTILNDIQEESGKQRSENECCFYNLRLHFDLFNLLLM
ncbi:hypothetical protein MKW94_004790, partial [Papaver nudicaule]|nr:hypothetical protein [Papaver nudicaule]MCL7044511.1 hypothetical protein [Papaver nudicaule]